MANVPNPASPVNPVNPIESGEPQAETQNPVEQQLPKALGPKPEADVADRYRDNRSDRTFQARQSVHQSEEGLGHKIEYHQTERNTPQPRQFQRNPATPEHYRELLRDPIFRQPGLKDSHFQRYVSQRALPEGERDQLQQNMLSRFFGLRHQVANKQNIRQIIHSEVQEQREADKAPSFAELPTSEPGKGPTSDFEKALHTKNPIPNLPTGKLAQWASKNEAGWKEFFSNMLQMGNTEAPMTRSMSQLVNALFRGLYKAMANQKGMTLVSDLNFMMGDKIVAEKFAKVLVDNPQLLQLLEQLTPGDAVPKDLLAKLGEELNFIQLAHVPDVPSQASKEAARDALMAQLKNPTNAGALSRLEQALREDRQKVQADKEKEEKRRQGLVDDGEMTGFRARLGDPRWEQQERLGRPQSWIYFLYSVGGVSGGLLLYLLFRLIF